MGLLIFSIDSSPEGTISITLIYPIASDLIKLNGIPASFSTKYSRVSRASIH